MDKRQQQSYFYRIEIERREKEDLDQVREFVFSGSFRILYTLMKKITRREEDSNLRSLAAYTLSRRAHSTTLPSLQNFIMHSSPRQSRGRIRQRFVAETTLPSLQKVFPPLRRQGGIFASRRIIFADDLNGLRQNERRDQNPNHQRNMNRKKPEDQPNQKRRG